jgi:hypothetical protein
LSAGRHFIFNRVERYILIDAFSGNNVPVGEMS